MNILTTLPTELIFIIVSLLSISSRFTLSYVLGIIPNNIKININNNININNLDDFYRARYRESLILDIISNNYTDLFEWFTDNNCRFLAKDKRLYCKMAIINNNFRILKRIYLHNHSNICSHDSIILNEAIGNGQFDMAKWLYDNGCKFIGSESYEKASSIGRIDILEWLKTVTADTDDVCSWDLNSCYYAASNGHLDTLKYLLENGCPRQLHGADCVCVTAAHNGHLDILQYLHEKDCSKQLHWNERTIEYAVDAPIEDIALKIIQYLRNNGCPWNDRACSKAAEVGRFQILKYLRSDRDKCPWNESACSRAAENGHFEILKYLREHNCPWNEFTCIAAAKTGRLKILQWLRSGDENGNNVCPWNDCACEYAAKNGHFEVLKWLHENGCPWVSYSTHVAARQGHLLILKYLHDNGCPWDEWTSIEAIKNGELEILEYLYENGCPIDEKAFTYAAQNGHLSILKWLADRMPIINNNEWAKDWITPYAAENGHYEVLKWLKSSNKIRCEWNTTTCAYAAKRGHFEILKWLRKNECPWDSSTHYYTKQNGHIEILRYATENGCPSE